MIRLISIVIYLDFIDLLFDNYELTNYILFDYYIFPFSLRIRFFVIIIWFIFPYEFNSFLFLYEFDSLSLHHSFFLTNSILCYYCIIPFSLRIRLFSFSFRIWFFPFLRIRFFVIIISLFFSHEFDYFLLPSEFNSFLFLRIRLFFIIISFLFPYEFNYFLFLFLRIRFFIIILFLFPYEFDSFLFLFLRIRFFITILFLFLYEFDIRKKYLFLRH